MRYSIFYTSGLAQFFLLSIAHMAFLAAEEILDQHPVVDMGFVRSALEAREPPADELWASPSICDATIPPRHKDIRLAISNATYSLSLLIVCRFMMIVAQS
ncbi:hypothetical protein [Argonema galeatum]|uniref:hypothetical protein n=1 Tax=Argonema galeatum TaxID=2942762 RepID=UPI0020128B45|nr:hypothetical protein [Argonema galeatum]MCL1463419.1 hypothetical protein [Argonema galeatum A003/A1]